MLFSFGFNYIEAFTTFHFKVGVPSVRREGFHINKRFYKLHYYCVCYLSSKFKKSKNARFIILYSL